MNIALYRELRQSQDGQSKEAIFTSTLLDLWEDLSALWTVLGNIWLPQNLYTNVPLDPYHSAGSVARRWKKLVGPENHFVFSEEEPLIRQAKRLSAKERQEALKTIQRKYRVDLGNGRNPTFLLADETDQKTLQFLTQFKTETGSWNDNTPTYVRKFVDHAGEDTRS